MRGEANDAASAQTLVKISDSARSLKLPCKVCISIENCQLFLKREPCSNVGKLEKKFDLEDPAPLLNQVYLGRAQRDAVTKKRNRQGQRSDTFAKLTSSDTDVFSEKKAHPNPEIFPEVTT